MKLEIISPEKQIFNGNADGITLPGAAGIFSVLDNHVSMISILKTGTITINHSGKEDNIDIKDGVIEVKNNVVVVCVNE